MRRRASVLLMAAALACALATLARAESDNRRDGVGRAAVRIMAGEFDGARTFHVRSSATGVLVSADGYVLTARHAVFAGEGPADLYPEIRASLAEPRQDYVLPNRAVRLRFVAADPKTDLALFQIQPPAQRRAQTRYPFLRLAANLDVAYGDTLRVVGYPDARSPQGSDVKVGVVELDEVSDWIKVDGNLIQGLTGAAVVNERGELVGIPIKVAPQEVALFDGGEAPVGRIELERVGMLRPAASIARFMGQALKERFQQQQTGDAGRFDVLVLDERTARPIAGATVGILKPDATSPEFFVAPDELLSYGRSDDEGRCVLSRRLAPGRYVVKAVHENYETKIAEIRFAPDSGRLEVKMRPVPK